MSSVDQNIPTISLWQPWAAALVVSHPKYPDTAIKQWETRGWKIPEKYIGKRVLVHAAKKDDSENGVYVHQFPFADYKSELKRAMHYGAIIGSVVLDSYMTTEKWLETHNTGRYASEEKLLGDYSAGRYAWKLTGYIWFPQPIHVRGYQKIYGTPLSLIPSPFNNLFK